MIWWDRQLNVLHGCTRVSAECANCWAICEARRWSTSPKLLDAVRRRWAGTLNVDRSDWSGRLTFDRETLLSPLRRRQPTTYFVNAVSDTFHEAVLWTWLDELFAVMALCQQHTFILCTKRTNVCAGYVMSRYPLGIRVDEAPQWYQVVTRWLDEGAGGTIGKPQYDRLYDNICKVDIERPLPNVYLGYTAGLQVTFNARWSDMASLAALGWKVWLSAEPLLGPMDLTDAIHDLPTDGAKGRLCGVIAGGESGPKARPVHPHWARELRDQCQAYGVPFAWKQWGTWRPWRPGTHFLCECGYLDLLNDDRLAKHHDGDGCTRATMPVARFRHEPIRELLDSKLHFGLPWTLHGKGAK